MRVSIDQDLCTGDGLCEDVCAPTFTVADDGIAYVREDAKYFGRTTVLGWDSGTVGGLEGQACVPEGWEAAVIEAAESCPGECIFIEVDEGDAG